MTTSRRSKIIRIISIYFFLAGLVISASWASYDIDFNHFMLSHGALALQIENYFGQFFHLGWLIVAIGFIFAAIWAMRSNSQQQHAKWFRNASIAAVAINFILSLLAIPLSRVDCGSSCGWSMLPDSVALVMALGSTLFWYLISVAIYKFMLRNSQ